MIFRIIVLILLWCVSAHAQVVQFSGSPQSGLTTFSVLRVDGGGFVTNIAMSCDQGFGACSPGVGTATKIARTDTAGAWIWKGGCTQTVIANPCWTPILQTSKFPDSDIGWAFGVCEVAVAPSNSSHMYAYFTANTGSFVAAEHGYMYESTNKGDSWVRATTSFDHPCDANDQGTPSTRLISPYIAVDPVAEQVVLVGTPESGLQITTNGGNGVNTSWSRLTGVGIAIPPVGATGTSVTTVTVGTGAQTFTVGAGLGFFATQGIQIWETSAPGTVQMQGTVTSYSGTTLVVNITTIYGSGSHSDWSLGGWPLSAGGQSGGHLIAFDPSSAVVAGRTQGIFATSYGTGVYHSTDAGGTWTLLNTANMPTTFANIKVAPNGNLWVVDAAATDKTGALWLWTSIGGWVKKITNGNFSQLSAVAIDPANANHIFAADYHGYLNISTDGGTTFPTISVSWSPSSPLVPWLDFGVGQGAGADNTVAIASMDFDPSTTKLYIASGVGVFSTTPPITNANVVWDGSPTLGIQNLDTIVGYSTPGLTQVFLANQDRNVWIIGSPGNVSNTTQSKYYPTTRRNNSWGGNGVVLTQPTWWFMSEAINGTLISNDSGTTWNVLSSLPANEVPNGFGAVAKTITAYSLNNAVIMLSNDQGPYVLSSGALNSSPVWSDPTFTNGAIRADRGWGHSQLTSFTSLAMDYVTAHSYCMYNDGTGVNQAGFYNSTNGILFGRTAAPGATGQLDATFTGFFTIASVPSHAGHYFAANLAYIFSPLPNAGIKLWHTTTDCNGTWTQVPNVESVIQFSLGAVCPGGSGYPSMFVVGFVDLLDGKGFTYGIYRSDNIDQVTPTWIKIGNGFPNGSFDSIQFITGDANTCGKGYGGFNNSGFFKWQLNYLLRRDINPAANDNSPMWLQATG